MSKRYVVDPTCLPTKIPVISTIVFYLLLSHLDASAWVWGATGMLFFVYWLGALANLGRETTSTFDKFGKK